MANDKVDHASPIMGGALAFFQHEAAGGIAMLLAATLALVVSNSALGSYYSHWIELPASIQFGALRLEKPLLHWINDGLMAIFFCLVALEIKREVLIGELSSRERALLPLLAAFGGILVPAAIYMIINAARPPARVGWAIPTATDIAFAMAVLSLIRPPVPPALKIFLLALAIIDDIAAIVVIALFYTAKLSVLALALGVLGVAALAALNLAGVRSLAPYLLVGILLWVCVLESGIHATLAGVLFGLALPLKTGDGEPALLERVEEGLHPWVAFGILPLFGLANAGVNLGALSLSELANTVTIGVVVGLVLGKPAGILGACWLAVRTGLCQLPQDTGWRQLAGVSILAGIGFTMSLFIGILAFGESSLASSVRVGVVLASLVGAVAGYALLKRLGSPREAGNASQG
jgi:NhaA family Na+:H+ antiporter